MKECDNSKTHISSNFILSISLLIMFDTLLLRPSLHCNTPLHFTTLHPTTLRYTSPHFTQLHFAILHHTSPNYTSLYFTTLHPSTLHYTYRHFTSSHLHFPTLSFRRADVRGVQYFNFQERMGPVRNSEGVCFMGAQKLTSKQRNYHFSVQYVESRTEVTFESIGPEKATGAGLEAGKIRNFPFLTL